MDFDQYEIGGFHPSTAAHVARHDPARVLAEVEAKRRLLVHVDLIWKHSPSPAEARAWQHAVRHLALPYAGHPDYRQEWRP